MTHGRLAERGHVKKLGGCARQLANLLDSRNRERQQVQQKITELALFETEGISEQHFVVVAGDGWHQGVIGLAASRIAEKLYRPTIVLSIKDGYGHGSARSIPGFHLLKALDTCEDLFEAYGGHAAAAGAHRPLLRGPLLRRLPLRHRPGHLRRPRPRHRAARLRPLRHPHLPRAGPHPRRLRGPRGPRRHRGALPDDPLGALRGLARPAPHAPGAGPRARLARAPPP